MTKIREDGDRCAETSNIDSIEVPLAVSLASITSWMVYVAEKYAKSLLSKHEMKRIDRSEESVCV